MFIDDIEQFEIIYRAIKRETSPEKLLILIPGTVFYLSDNRIYIWRKDAPDTSFEPHREGGRVLISRVNPYEHQ